VITRHRVAGLLIVDDAILLEATVGTELWGVPGGGLEHGESLVDGCRRELVEEVGIEVTCDSLAIVHESFWDDCGQLVREYGFYFRVTPATPLSRDVPVASREPRLKFRWCPLGELTVLDFVPPALPAVLAALPPHTVFLQTGTPRSRV
jgi:8-oxo-dGTP pyrophosphatase MutT (NUDIX family)